MSKYLLLIGLFYTNIIVASPLDFKSFIGNLLKNNLDIQTYNLQVSQSKAQHTKSLGEFDLSLSFDTSYNNQDTPISSSLDTEGNTSSVLTKTFTESLTFNKTFTSGTQLSIPFSYDLVDSNSSYRTYRKTNEPNFGVTLTQPLVRIFSKGYYTKSTDGTWLSYREKDFETKQKVSKTLYQGIEKLFDYMEAKKTYQILKNGHKTSLKNYDFMKKKKSLGSASLIDLLDSETQKNKSKQKVLQHEIKLHQQEGELQTFVYGKQKTILNIGEIDLKAKDYDCECNLDSMLKEALLSRGDYLAKEYNVDAQELKSRFTLIDRLPKIDLELSYSNQAIREKSSEALGDLTSGKYSTTKAGLTLSYNLFQYAERGAEEINHLKLKQSEIKLTEFIKNLRIEIENATRSFEIQKIVVSSLKKSANAEKVKWKFYSKKFKQGQVSSFDLAKYQDAKENADLELIKGKYKLERSYFKLFQVQGKLTNLLTQL